jgi:hypothetical protein
MPVHVPLEELRDRVRRAGWSVGDVGHGDAVVRERDQRGERPDRGSPQPGGGLAPGVRAGGGRGDAGAVAAHFLCETLTASGSCGSSGERAAEAARQRPRRARQADLAAE